MQATDIRIYYEDGMTYVDVGSAMITLNDKALAELQRMVNKAVAQSRKAKGLPA